jgi:hypothetical protein
MPRNRHWGAVVLASDCRGVSMSGKPLKREGGAVSGRAAPGIGLVAAALFALFPAAARAQVNIDQGKSPAEIYSSDCATCHKTPRGLAAGKNSLMLSTFLREHYTASRDQAAALAAYVLGAGGAEAAPKPKPETARAEEPKPGEPRGGEKPAHPVRAASAKPEQLPRPKEQDARHEERPSPAAAAKPGEEGPATQEAAPVAAAPAVSAAPAGVETSNATPSATAGSASSPQSSPTANATPSAVPNQELGSTTSAAASTEEQPSGAAAVPRDNIPD